MCEKDVMEAIDRVLKYIYKRSEYWSGGFNHASEFNLDGDNRVVVFREGGWICGRRGRYRLNPQCDLTSFTSAWVDIPVTADVVMYGNKPGGRLRDFRIECNSDIRVVTALLQVHQPWLLFELNKIIGRGAGSLYITPVGSVEASFNWRRPFTPDLWYKEISHFHLYWDERECDWRKDLPDPYRARAERLTKLLTKNK